MSPGSTPRASTERWIQRTPYTEAGPHLAPQAFRHRMVSAKRRVGGEYALGSGRVDLMVAWPQGKAAARAGAWWNARWSRVEPG